MHINPLLNPNPLPHRLECREVDFIHCKREKNELCSFCPLFLGGKKKKKKKKKKPLGEIHRETFNGKGT